jgi:hypothetical protein
MSHLERHLQWCRSSVWVGVVLTDVKEVRDGFSRRALSRSTKVPLLLNCLPVLLEYPHRLPSRARHAFQRVLLREPYTGLYPDKKVRLVQRATPADDIQNLCLPPKRNTSEAAGVLIAKSDRATLGVTCSRNERLRRLSLYVLHKGDQGFHSRATLWRRVTSDEWCRPDVASKDWQVTR